MTLTEQAEEDAVEQVISKMAAALGLKLCWQSGDATWELHKQSSGELVFFGKHGNPVFKSLREVLQAMVSEDSKLVHECDWRPYPAAFQLVGLKPAPPTPNIFAGCSGLDEMLLKLAVLGE